MSNNSKRPDLEQLNVQIAIAYGIVLIVVFLAIIALRLVLQ